MPSVEQPKEIRFMTKNETKVDFYLNLLRANHKAIIAPQWDGHRSPILAGPYYIIARNIAHQGLAKTKTCAPNQSENFLEPKRIFTTTLRKTNIEVIHDLV